MTGAGAGSSDRIAAGRLPRAGHERPRCPASCWSSRLRSPSGAASSSGERNGTFPRSSTASCQERSGSPAISPKPADVQRSARDGSTTSVQAQNQVKASTLSGPHPGASHHWCGAPSACVLSAVDGGPIKRLGLCPDTWTVNRLTFNLGVRRHRRRQPPPAYPTLHAPLVIPGAPVEENMV
jgi:hypothetical protein